MKIDQNVPQVLTDQNVIPLVMLRSVIRTETFTIAQLQSRFSQELTKILKKPPTLSWPFIC